MKNVRLFAASLFAGSLAACQMPPPASSEASQAIPVVASSGVIQAEIEGRLRFDGNCLLLIPERTSDPLVVVWPEGTAFDGEAVSFPVPTGPARRIRIGESITISGSLQTWPGVAHLASIQPYRSCAQQLLFAVEVSRS